MNILLVTARPYQGDVAYRSISRPLVELIHAEGLPTSVKMLHPPTFDQLKSELQDHPGQYHIVHFDGHRGFGQAGAGEGGGTDRFKGPQGHLVFEKADGRDDPVAAGQLSQLLREHRIPIAVLNACQSAMLNEQAEDAFASVATALLRAGVRSVVAMGYSLYVSAAQQFLPAFYGRLFRTGSVAEAVRGGRQAMLARPQRRDDIELQDWLVPVLYQQRPLALDFTKQARTEQPEVHAAIPRASPRSSPSTSMRSARSAASGSRKSATCATSVSSSTAQGWPAWAPWSARARNSMSLTRSRPTLGSNPADSEDFRAGLPMVERMVERSRRRPRNPRRC